MANELLTLAGVGKDYPVIDNLGGHVHTLVRLLRGVAAPQSFRALNDISFSLKRGESLGIIGENGAGKSTLLKIVAGVIRPSRGTVSVVGRVGALLELGSGFHPEYTGLENIDLSAALLGLSVAEVRRKRDEIVAFADIGEHMGQPLKHYSSGMVARLGFAVATVLRPDILITDEVLAVGDESFQRKCTTWLESYLARGGTLLLCSHNIFHIQKLCQKALWLQGGKARLYGSVSEVTQAYLTYHEEKRVKQKDSMLIAESLYRVSNLEIITNDNALQFGSDLNIKGELYSPDGQAPVVAIGIVRADGTPIYGIVSDMDDFVPIRLSDNLYSFNLIFPALILLPGKYKLRAHAMDPNGLRMFDEVEREFVVCGDTRELGFCKLPHRWEGKKNTI